MIFKLGTYIFLVLCANFIVNYVKAKGVKCRPPPSIIIENKNAIHLMNTSVYYKSLNSANWSPARQDCKNIFGEEASLLEIQTQEEITEVEKFLEKNDDTATTFWVDGRFSSDEGKWKWLNSEISFWPWIEWNNDSENIGFFPTAVSAAFLIYRGVGSIKPIFDYDFISANYRYICEIPRKVTEEWC